MTTDRKRKDTCFGAQVDGEFITHIYDFGTETLCVLEGLDRYPGRIRGGKKLALLARNPAPEFTCDACGGERAEVSLHGAFFISYLRSWIF